nr:platelet-activating factor acetylhydrolase IB subunit gamma-like [Aotus nancymaae]
MSSDDRGAGSIERQMHGSHFQDGTVSVVGKETEKGKGGVPPTSSQLDCHLQLFGGLALLEEFLVSKEEKCGSRITGFSYSPGLRALSLLFNAVLTVVFHILFGDTTVEYLLHRRVMSEHHRFVADSKDKEPEVVFIGDSLVQLMHQCEIWRELVSPLHALNFGIGGDRTQHVLWRLENGELEHIRPKIVVVWVGTNNHGHTAEQVTGGIKAIVQLVNERQPQARVVVLGLLPRGQHPNPLREKNQRVNELVRAALAGHPRAHFLDADPGFVHSDGTISHHDMYDYLHLSRLGYTPVCRTLHSLLLRLLAQDQGQGAPLPEPAP